MMVKKILVITGASRGIGKASAQLFSENGYRVINLSRSKPELSNIEHLEVDLSDAKSVEAKSNSLLEQLDGSENITVIHNAGLLLKDTARSLTVENFQRVMQINVIAPSQLNTLLLPKMKPGSSILYVGSTLSEKGVANTCSYVTSKHAILGLMRATCQDLVGSEIHTACICPGFTDTEMLSDHVGANRDILASIAEGIALKRLAEPAEIAKTLLFAAQNPVINGAVLHANLGQIEQ